MPRTLPTPLSVGTIAERLGATVRGDPDRLVTAVASLKVARAGDLSFFSDKRHIAALAACEATALIAPADTALPPGVAHIVSAGPHLDFIRLLNELFSDKPLFVGLSKHSTYHSTSVLNDVNIADHCGIGEKSYIGAGTTIHSGVQIGANVQIGRDCVIYAGVVVNSGVRIGDRCVIQSGAVIGSDGFGFQPSANGWLKVPQVGGVWIGDDVEIGANTCIDRGAIEDTVIGNGVKIDNLVQIAHNVHIGEHTAIAGCAGIAGSAVIGKRCMIGGAAMIQGHIEICDDVVISGATYVTDSIREKGRYTAVFPYGTHREWLRMAGNLRRSAKSSSKKKDTTES